MRVEDGKYKKIFGEVLSFELNVKISAVQRTIIEELKVFAAKKNYFDILLRLSLVGGSLNKYVHTNLEISFGNLKKIIFKIQWNFNRFSTILFDRKFIKLSRKTFGDYERI